MLLNIIYIYCPQYAFNDITYYKRNQKETFCKKRNQHFTTVGTGLHKRGDALGVSARPPPPHRAPSVVDHNKEELFGICVPALVWLGNIGRNKGLNYVLI
jgi:hypothetical protein